MRSMCYRVASSARLKRWVGRLCSAKAGWAPAVSRSSAGREHNLGRVERRLVPLNALVAMCTPGDVYPAPLADARYHLAGVEIPVVAGDSKVVIDAVLFRPD